MGAAGGGGDGKGGRWKRRSRGGASVNLIMRNKCHRHSTEGKKTTEASSFCLPEESGIAQWKTWRILELFLRVLLSLHLLFLSPVFVWFYRKAQYRRHLWLRAGEMEESRAEGLGLTHSWFQEEQKPGNWVSGGNYKDRGWQIEALRCFWEKNNSKRRKMSLTSGKSMDVTPKPEL